MSTSNQQVERSRPIRDHAGTIRWQLPDGKLHRDNGPAVEFEDGTKTWWHWGKRHREDGPAVEHADGYKEWWIDGLRHREGAPALMLANGHKEWWVRGDLHRLDGPAIEHMRGVCLWYIEGVHYEDAWSWARAALERQNAKEPTDDEVNAKVQQTLAKNVLD